MSGRYDMYGFEYIKIAELAHVTNSCMLASHNQGIGLRTRVDCKLYTHWYHIFARNTTETPPGNECQW